MRAEQLDAFVAMYRDVMGLYGRAPTSTQEAMVFRALAAHDLRAVRAALDAHIRDPQRGRFVPLPADLLAHLDGDATSDGRPGPQEAWAMSLPAADQSRTVVWTAEMSEAWGIAWPVLHEHGDEVGARMAFLEAYTRLVAVARKAGRPVEWTSTLGTDARLRDDALRVAVDAGRLPLAALPAPAAPQPVGLLELAQRRGVPDHIRAKVAALRLAETPREAECRQARERDQELKAAHAARMAARAAAQEAQR